MPELPTWIRADQQCRLKLDIIGGELYSTRKVRIGVSLGGQTLAEMTLPNQQARELFDQQPLSLPVRLVGQIREQDQKVQGTLLAQLPDEPPMEWPLLAEAAQGNKKLLGLAEFESTKQFDKDLRGQDVQELTQSFLETVMVRRNWGPSQGWTRQELPTRNYEHSPTPRR